MARLPTPAIVTDLHFVGPDRIEATIYWDGDDPYAELMRGLYLRFLLSNLEDLGVGDDEVSTAMQSWADHTDVGSPMEVIIPAWAMNLQMQYFDLLVRISETEAKAGQYLFTWRASVLAQRFVRMIVQARTAD